MGYSYDRKKSDVVRRGGARRMLSMVLSFVLLTGLLPVGFSFFPGGADSENIAVQSPIAHDFSISEPAGAPGPGEADAPAETPAPSEDTGPAGSGSPADAAEPGGADAADTADDGAAPADTAGGADAADAADTADAGAAGGGEGENGEPASGEDGIADRTDAGANPGDASGDPAEDVAAAGEIPADRNEQPDAAGAKSGAEAYGSSLFLGPEYGAAAVEAPAAAAEQIVGAAEGQYLVRFYNGTDLLLSMFVDEGDAARYPEMDLGAYFIGWYMDGAGESQPYDFQTPVYGDIDLFAQFNNTCLVQFLDGYGSVCISKIVGRGSPVAQPSVSEMESVSMPHNKIFEYWSANPAAPYSAYNFNAPVNGNLMLRPVLADAVYVYFVSYGSEVQPVKVKTGATVQRPSETPVRENYEFLYWTKTPGGLGAQYDWGGPVGADVVLYAAWKGLPNSAKYKVVWWLEAPNFKGAPQYGRAADYIFAESAEFIGTPGEYAVVNSLPTYAGERDVTDPLRYASFQYSAPTLISGAGNTIVNVYLTRNVYRITFDLVNPAYSMNFINGGGVAYTGSEYYIDVKYEQDVTDIWPSTATCVFSPVGFQFESWETQGGVNVGENIYLLTRRNVMSGEVMPKDPASAGYTLRAYEAIPDKYSVRYWIEALPGQPGQARIFNSKKYVLDSRYSQDNVMKLNPKQITGLENVGIMYSETETGAVFEDIEGNIIQHIFYDRNLHDLVFDMGGAPVSIPAAKDLMYGLQISGYKPEDPEWPGYVFSGWYKDGDRTLAFDFDSAEIPAYTDLTVFAKWESLDNAVTFMDGDAVLGTQGVADGSPVNFNNLWFDGRFYTQGLYVPGKGTFIGWLYYPKNSDALSPYPIDLLIYDDLTLYADWNKDGFRVTYRLDGSAAGSVAPVDANEYSIGTYTSVMSGGAMLPNPGYVFIGWRIDNAGAVYFPGSLIAVDGNITLYPYFVSYAYLTQIIYDNNYSKAPERVSITVEKNTFFPLAAPIIFSNVPNKRAFICWRAVPEPGAGVSYNPGENVFIGNEPLILYAEWEPAEPEVEKLQPWAVAEKVPGNQNFLTVYVLEKYDDGSEILYSERFQIHNNAIDIYQVGPYRVYVDTKGNIQIRECYIVN